MKKINVNPSHNLEDINGLLFFTECLEELLFVHANDSFKAPALNTFTRINELENLLRQAFGTKKTRSLLPVLDELDWSIDSDPVFHGIPSKQTAKEMIKSIRDQVKANNLANLLDLVSTARALKLLANNYKERIKNLIESQIIEGKDKSSLSSLASNLVVQLETEGYSKRYIHYVTKITLVKELIKKKPTSLKDAITNFFANFNDETEEYEVVLRCSDDITQFSNYPGIDIKEGRIDLKKKDFIDSTTLNKYLIITVEANDPISARDTAFSRLKAYTAVSKFYSHSLSPKVTEHCIVKNLKTKKEVHVSPPVSAMLQGTERMSDEETTNKVIEFSRSLIKLDASSQRRMLNAFQYHKEALDSHALENQLVDLWAALEGFIPQPIDDQPRIQHYVEYILPSLVLTYPEKIFRYIAQALYHSDREIREIVTSIKIEGAFELKVTALIVCPELADYRNRVCGKLNDHPLLRFRMFRAYEQYHSAEKIFDAIEFHKIKLTWHLNRIYNTRNTIMHSARALPYLETLVENLHAYLDILLNSTARIAVLFANRTDITAILKMLVAEERSLFSQLRIAKEQQVAISLDNFSDVIFGIGNPLREI